MFVVHEADKIWAAVRAVSGTVVIDTRTAEEVHEAVEKANMAAIRRSTSFVSGVIDRVDRFRKRRPVGVSTRRPTGR